MPFSTREEVRRFGPIVREDYLGRHVRGLACDLGNNWLGATAAPLSEAEVGELDDALRREQKVIGLQVSVDDTGRWCMKARPSVTCRTTSAASASLNGLCY